MNFPPPPPPGRGYPAFPAPQTPPPTGLSFIAGFGFGILAATIIAIGYLALFFRLFLAAGDWTKGWEIVAIIFIVGGFGPLLGVAGVVSSAITGLIVWLGKVRSGWIAFGIGLLAMIGVVQTGVATSDFSPAFLTDDGPDGPHPGAPGTPGAPEPPKIE